MGLIGLHMRLVSQKGELVPENSRCFELHAGDAATGQVGGGRGKYPFAAMFNSKNVRFIDQADYFAFKRYPFCHEACLGP